MDLKEFLKELTTSELFVILKEMTECGEDLETIDLVINEIKKRKGR